MEPSPFLVAEEGRSSRYLNLPATRNGERSTPGGGVQYVRSMSCPGLLPLACGAFLFQSMKRKQRSEWSDHSSGPTTQNVNAMACISYRRSWWEGFISPSLRDPVPQSRSQCGTGSRSNFHLRILLDAINRVSTFLRRLLRLETRQCPVCPFVPSSLRPFVFSLQLFPQKGKLTIRS